MVPSHFSLIYLAFSSTTSALGTIWEFASRISAARSPAIRVILRKIHSMNFRRLAHLAVTADALLNCEILRSWNWSI
jgi:hypothetical protein